MRRWSVDSESNQDDTNEERKSQERIEGVVEQAPAPESQPIETVYTLESYDTNYRSDI